jgi:oxygen-independent coproporphyrinogen-3 oxidase
VPSSGLGLYIHIPFCRAKCGYCDFNSVAGQEAQFGHYAAALAREMQQAGPLTVRSVYVGGGTPTVLPLPLLSGILESARRAFCVEPGAEVSLEANPGTVGPETLAALRALGVTRLSLGVQSLDEGGLRLLGRIHTPDEAVQACRAARWAGFESVNLDLIFGLPGQSLAAWRATLERALALRPDHLSLYALSLEEGTPLAAAVARGDLPEPDEDVAADMYELAESVLAAAGFVHYEISNWAAGEAHQCRHNLVYWRNEPYLGLGAGAHSWAGGQRRANVASPAQYIARVLAGESAVAEQETIGPELEMGETMMLGLRLLEEGVEYSRFRARFGVELRERYAREIEELSACGLIIAGTERIRLSQRGHLLGNQAFLRFLPEQS